MAQAQKNNKPGFKQEFVAILGLFVAAFMLLSLISEQLPSVQNWCGEIGRLVAQLLLGFTGWGHIFLQDWLSCCQFFFSVAVCLLSGYRR
jgi:S-DNA-T family DNA segregation ATPase FtsK/SpoIIIE